MVPIVALLLGSCLAAPLPDSLRHAWVYRIRDTLDVGAAIGAWRNARLGALYLSLDPLRLDDSARGGSPRYARKVVELLDSCAGSRIAVHAMVLQEHELALPEHHARALARIESFARFVDRHPRLRHHPLEGLHFDVEPHALPQWSSKHPAVCDTLLRGYQELLRRADSLAHGTESVPGRLPWARLSAAIGHFHDRQAASGKTPSGDPSVWARHLDVLVPMAYLDGGRWDGESLEAKVSTTWRYARGEVEAAPTVVGVRGSRFQTAAERAALEQGLMDSARGNPNFRGVAWFGLPGSPTLDIDRGDRGGAREAGVLLGGRIRAGSADPPSR
jgi:hypothetical protein